MGLAKSDGMSLHANEFQFKTWYPPLEKTPSSLSFKVVPKFRTSSVHWFGSGNSGSLLCINTGNNRKSFIILCWSEPKSRLNHGKTTQGASFCYSGRLQIRWWNLFKR
ncbi:hypothetical protein EZV62_013081 [Acer yangbiense]|uniref:Uncharacterized protein n=1 Tax=Acer yangbiense TaxID=1000413 RepID=A0A5C7HXZ2_9ROSI|nr:hypothetical protein EZV62_013081 [Acer yangbiense]